MPHLPLAIAVLPLLAGAALAQATLVAPAGAATVEGNANNAVPWSRGMQSARVQFLYDSSHFTSQGADRPIRISRLRYRADAGTHSWTGGAWPNVRIDLATATVDHAAAQQVFASNLGADATIVHQGPVVVQGGTGNGAGTPGPWYIDIPVLPFLYDPSSGDDLVVDIHLDGTGWTGTATAADHLATIGGAVARCSRVYTTASLASPTGVVQHEFGAVCEFTWAVAAGHAWAAAFGTGCIEDARSSFYERFANGSFDLSNTGLSFVPTGTGYAVVPNASPQWFTPTSPPLPLTDDSVSPLLALGFTLVHPAGATTALRASSNGFVWSASNFDHGCCAGDPAALLARAARWCPLWCDLDPELGGAVHFDTDPANGAAYVTFLDVREGKTAALNRSTFQVALFSSGNVEFRFRACAVTASPVLTGWSPGGGQLDPGAVDLSAIPFLVTDPDLRPLQHRASARPRLGATIQLRTTVVPPGIVIGATLAGLVALDPGVDLTPLGMPGCRRHQSADAALLWLPAQGTGSSPFTIPVDTSLAGTVLTTQSAALVPGINALGAIVSNGLRLHIEAQ